MYRFNGPLKEKEWCDCLNRLLNITKQEYLRISTNISTFTQSNFSLTEMVDKYYNLYTKLNKED